MPNYPGVEVAATDQNLPVEPIAGEGIVGS
jgi:hypothetical protein